MYSIQGFRKVKTRAEFASIAIHNMRIKLSAADKDRIDPQRIKFNEVLINEFGASKIKADLGAKFFEHFEKKEIEVKKDSVLAIDLMLSASPEFWGEWHKDGQITPQGRQKIDLWKATELDLVRGQFGPDAVKFAILHLDESSPHLHILISPEEKKEVTHKNRFGTKTVIKTVLNAKRWNPEYWTKFVTAHAQANEKYGLKRGEEASLAKNITIKEFRRRMKMATNEDFLQVIDKMLTDFVDNLSFVSTPKQVKEQFKKTFEPALKKLIKSNKALKASAERVISERDLYIKLRKDFEKRQADFEREKRHHEAKYTEIDRLRGELKAAHQKNAALEMELEKVRPSPKTGAGFLIQRKPGLHSGSHPK